MEHLLDFRPEQSTRAEVQRISIILVVNIAMAAIAIGVLTGDWFNIATICGAVLFVGAALVARHLQTATLQVGPDTVVHGSLFGQATQIPRASIAQVLYIADPARRRATGDRVWILGHDGAALTRLHGLTWGSDLTLISRSIGVPVTTVNDPDLATLRESYPAAVPLWMAYPMRVGVGVVATAIFVALGLDRTPRAVFMPR